MQLATMTDTARTDSRFHLHSQTNPGALEAAGPMLLTHGEGCHVFDEAGRRYIDAMAGLWCASLGFSNARLAAAAARQYVRFGFYHTFNQKTPTVTVALAEQLAALSPIPNARVYFATSGSEAVETMVKLAWLHHAQRGRPAKRKIISRQRAFHGSTVVAASMTGLPRMHREFGLPLPGFLHAECPDFYRNGRPGESEAAFVARLAADLDTMILREGADTVAAFAAEPINAGGGVVVPPAGYFEAIQRVLARHDVLLLDDEIVCGFGRTGHWFGCQAVGMQPDLVALAKGLSSSYFPISAVLVSEPVYRSLAAFNADGSVFGHGFTNSGHPVGAAVALEALAIYREMDVVQRVRRQGARLKAGLEAVAQGSPIVGQVRGEGLMLGVELVEDRATRRPFAPGHGVGAEFDRRAIAKGMITRLMGDTVGFCPPLVAAEPEIDEMLDIFTRTLREVEAWLG